MSRSVLWLHDPQCRDAVRVGNKSATLASLVQRGHRIPEGFVVTTDGRHPGWQAEVQDALLQLASPWAVRSSSTAEDAAGLAFAGLFATVLGLSDAALVMPAIVEVIDSLDSDGVAAYAGHHGLDPSAMRMGVLVQTLVPATVAGVAFSRDPLTDLAEVVIEANYGLGATVVDGSVVPDGMRVSSAGAVVGRRLGSKREKLVCGCPGASLRRMPTSTDEQTAFAVSDDVAVEIGAVVRQLEADLGMPVDVEWAIANDSLHVLQVRPITRRGRDSHVGSPGL